MRAREEFSGEVDAVLPVPLHRAKLRERGYNQSEAIARGIAAATGLPVEGGILRRSRWTPSQTTLGVERAGGFHDSPAAEPGRPRPAFPAGGRHPDDRVDASGLRGDAPRRGSLRRPLLCRRAPPWSRVHFLTFVHLCNTFIDVVHFIFLEFELFSIIVNTRRQAWR